MSEPLKIWQRETARIFVIPFCKTPTTLFTLRHASFNEYLTCALYHTAGVIAKDVNI